MSDFLPGESVFAPSPARRRLAPLASRTGAVLAVLLLASGVQAYAAAPGGTVLWLAVLCGIGALACAATALRAQRTRTVHLDSTQGLRATHVSPARTVLQCAQGRIVVWRDATDPGILRRLAVHARWCSSAFR